VIAAEASCGSSVTTAAIISGRVKREDRSWLVLQALTFP
jgi:hypothetical protein